MPSDTGPREGVLHRFRLWMMWKVAPPATKDWAAVRLNEIDENAGEIQEKAVEMNSPVAHRGRGIEHSVDNIRRDIGISEDDGV